MFVLQINQKLKSQKIFKMKNLIGLLIIGLLAGSCTKEEGCKDSNAVNFDSMAEKDNGTCIYDTPITEPVQAVESTVPITNNCDEYLFGKWEFQYALYKTYMVASDSLVETITLTSDMIDGDVEFFRNGTYQDSEGTGSWDLTSDCKTFTDNYDGTFSEEWEIYSLTSAELQLNNIYIDEVYYVTMETFYEKLQ